MRASPPNSAPPGGQRPPAEKVPDTNGMKLREQCLVIRLHRSGIGKGMRSFWSAAAVTPLWISTHDPAGTGRRFALKCGSAASQSAAVGGALHTDPRFASCHSFLTPFLPLPKTALGCSTGVGESPLELVHVSLRLFVDQMEEKPTRQDEQYEEHQPSQATPPLGWLVPSV